MPPPRVDSAQQRGTGCNEVRYDGRETVVGENLPPRFRLWGLVGPPLIYVGYRLCRYLQIGSGPSMITRQGARPGCPARQGNPWPRRGLGFSHYGGVDAPPLGVWALGLGPGIY